MSGVKSKKWKLWYLYLHSCKYNHFLPLLNFKVWQNRLFPLSLQHTKYTAIRWNWSKENSKRSWSCCTRRPSCPLWCCLLVVWVRNLWDEIKTSLFLWISEWFALFLQSTYIQDNLWGYLIYLKNTYGCFLSYYTPVTWWRGVGLTAKRLAVSANLVCYITNQ